jgi:hypothetical protein
VAVRHVHVAHGGGKTVMTQQPLPRGQIPPPFHRLRGKGLAQGMDTAHFGAARPALGRRGELLCGGGIQRPRCAALREQPGADGVIPLPVRA